MKYLGLTCSEIIGLSGNNFQNDCAGSMVILGVDYACEWSSTTVTSDEDVTSTVTSDEDVTSTVTSEEDVTSTVTSEEDVSSASSSMPT
jgi:hypothetical protein